MLDLSRLEVPLLDISNPQGCLNNKKYFEESVSVFCRHLFYRQNHKIKMAANDH